MKEFVVLFRNVVSRARAFPVFNNPVPSKLLNELPFTIKLVVEAVTNDE